mgnify:CR=1 FL=1
MNNAQVNDINQIFLFDRETQDSRRDNALKEFLKFLKFMTKKTTIDFCYSSGKNSLHSNLSIKENFILDAVPKSLIRDGEDNFKQFLETLKNPHLKKLIHKLGDLKRTTSSLDQGEIKLTTILKSLMSQSEYILLEAPEKEQHYENIELIKKAIQFEVYQRKRRVIIKAQNKDTWLDISGFIISKCENSHQFHCTLNPLLTNQNVTYLNNKLKSAA